MTNGLQGEPSESFGESPSGAVGRTGWDIAAGVSTSKMIWIILFAIVISIVTWLAWDTMTAMPFYVVSSIVVSGFWYPHFTRWLSRQSVFVEVWEPDTQMLTTWRVGRKALSQLKRDGVQNMVQSRCGSNRIFASHFDPENMVLENTWVHDCDPWTLHVDRGTIRRLTARVSEVYDTIADGESMANVEGRRKAMVQMRKHYSELDRLFEGDMSESPMDGIDVELRAMSDEGVQPDGVEHA